MGSYAGSATSPWQCPPVGRTQHNIAIQNMPPLTPPAATVLTDEEIVSIAIDAGYAVPENERHLAFGRAVVRALLAKAAPSPSAPTRQPDGGYPGCDACACKPGSCYINAMLDAPNAQEPLTRAMLDIASDPWGNNARAACAVAGIDPTEPFTAPSPSASTSAPSAYAIDVSGYKRLLDETAGAAERQAAHFRGRGHAVTVTPLGPLGASPADQGEA